MDNFMEQKRPGRNNRHEFMQEYPKMERVERSFKEEAARQGIGLGDLIKKATDALGIPPCPRCIRWRLILNKVKLLPNGMVEWNNGLPSAKDPGNPNQPR